MINTRTETVKRTPKKYTRALQVGERLQTITGDYVTIKDTFIDDCFYNAICYEVLENDTVYQYSDFEEFYNHKEVK